MYNTMLAYSPINYNNVFFGKGVVPARPQNLRARDADGFTQTLQGGPAKSVSRSRLGPGRQISRNAALRHVTRLQKSRGHLAYYGFARVLITGEKTAQKTNRKRNRYRDGRHTPIHRRHPLPRPRHPARGPFFPTFRALSWPRLFYTPLNYPVPKCKSLAR